MPWDSLNNWKKPLETKADPLDFSDKYNTPIPPNRLAEFNKWVAEQTKKTGRNPLGDRYDYDVNGFWLSGGGKDERGHGTDLFKKPNHPTFSDESIYHGKGGNFGGSWINGGKQPYYQASPLNNYYHGKAGLEDYFKKTEPEIQLLPSPQPPTVIK